MLCYLSPLKGRSVLCKSWSVRRGRSVQQWSLDTGSWVRCIMGCVFVCLYFYPVTTIEIGHWQLSPLYNGLVPWESCAGSGQDQERDRVDHPLHSHATGTSICLKWTAQMSKCKQGHLKRRRQIEDVWFFSCTCPRWSQWRWCWQQWQRCLAGAAIRRRVDRLLAQYSAQHAGTLPPWSLASKFCLIYNPSSLPLTQPDPL